jgi:hypothetical protein
MNLAVAISAWGGPPHRGATPTFAVIVHHENPERNLPLKELRAFFAGAARLWPNGSRVVLVERNSDSSVFKLMLKKVLNMSGAEYKRLLDNFEYTGQAPLAPKVLNSEGMACRFVFNVPGSIAVVETNSLASPDCGGIQILKIDGKLPSEEGYPLR